MKKYNTNLLQIKLNFYILVNYPLQPNPHDSAQSMSRRKFICHNSNNYSSTHALSEEALLIEGSIAAQTDEQGTESTMDWAEETNSRMTCSETMNKDSAFQIQHSSTTSKRIEINSAQETDDTARSSDKKFSEIDIDIGEQTAEEQEMDNMFPIGSSPTIEEIMTAMKPEDGMQFNSRDEAFMFFCKYARKTGFAVKKSSTRESRIDCKLDKQIFRCTKEGKKQQGKGWTKGEPTA